MNMRGGGYLYIAYQLQLSFSECADSKSRKIMETAWWAEVQNTVVHAPNHCFAQDFGAVY
jgi:hypothetical protein